MAKCDVCGLWAGIFKKRHGDCIPRESSTELASRIADAIKTALEPIAHGRFEIIVGANNIPDEQPVLEIPPASPTVRPSLPPIANAMSASEVAALIARRPLANREEILRKRGPQRTGPHARRIQASVPELHSVVGRLLRRKHVTDESVGPQVTAKLLELATSNGTEREFLKWCQSMSAPNEVRDLDKEWLGALFWTASALNVSARKMEEIWDEAIAEAFPFIQLDSYACRIPSHTALDQFTARREDPIWQIIWPPNDWLCQCSVIPLVKCDIENEALSMAPGHERLDPKLVFGCTDWYTRSPRAALKLLN